MITGRSPGARSHVTRQSLSSSSVRRHVTKQSLSSSTVRRHVTKQSLGSSSLRRHVTKRSLSSSSPCRHVTKRSLTGAGGLIASPGGTRPRVASRPGFSHHGRFLDRHQEYRASPGRGAGRLSRGGLPKTAATFMRLAPEARGPFEPDPAVGADPRQARVCQSHRRLFVSISPAPSRSRRGSASFIG